MPEINFTTLNSFLHYGVKGMKWGVINLDEPKGVHRRGNGLGTGPVGHGYSNHPGSNGSNVVANGRKASISGFGKSIQKRGNGLGTGPVGTSASKRPNTQKNKYGNKGQYNVPMEGRQKNVTGEVGKPIAKRGEGLNSDTPSQDMANMQNRPTPENKPEQIDAEYEQRKKEYQQISSDLDRYEKAFESIEDMDPKYQQKLFERYKDKMLDLVNRHQEVMGYKPYPEISNAKDMKLFFKYYHRAKEAEGY